MHVIIDLMGDEDVICTKKEELSKEELARREEVRKKALEDILKRAPRTQVITVDDK